MTLIHMDFKKPEDLIVAVAIGQVKSTERHNSVDGDEIESGRSTDWTTLCGDSLRKAEDSLQQLSRIRDRFVLSLVIGGVKIAVPR